MASSTPNINLVLPVGSENVSRQIINENNAKIDTAIGALPSGQSLQGEITVLNSNIGNCKIINSKYYGSATTLATIQSNIDSAISPYAEANKSKFMQFGYMNTTAAQSIGLRSACFINVSFTDSSIVLVEFVGVGTLNEINYMKKVTSWSSTIEPSLNSKYGNFGSTASPVTSLDDLPANGDGTCTLDASISPIGSTQWYSFKKYGNTANSRYCVILTYTGGSYRGRTWIGTVLDNVFGGWNEVALNKRKTVNYTNITISTAGGYMKLASYSSLGIAKDAIISIQDTARSFNGAVSFQLADDGLYIYCSNTVSNGNISLTFVYT